MSWERLGVFLANFDSRWAPWADAMSRMSLKSAKFRVDRLDIRNSTAGLRTLRLFRSFCSTRRLRLEHTTKRLRRWKSWRMIAESIVALSMFSSSWRVSKRKCLTDSKRLKLRCDISTMISPWITRMRATASKRPARNSQETRETRLVSKKGPTSACISHVHFNAGVPWLPCVRRSPP